MGFCLCLILILSRPKSRDNLCRSSMIRTVGYVWHCIGFWNKNLSGYNHNQMLARFIQSKVRTWKSLIVLDISKVWQWHQPRTVEKMHSCAQVTSGNDEVAAKACRIGRKGSYLDVYWLNFLSTATVSRHRPSLGLHEQDWLRLVGQREARICVSVSLAIRILSIF